MDGKDAIQSGNGFMEGSLTKMNFSNARIDYMPPEERERIIFSFFRRQFIFNKATIPFWARVYRDVGAESLQSYVDCISAVPSITKDSIRQLNSPYDLVADAAVPNIHLHRGTGGTTGEPTSMFFTSNDWAAILDAMTRSVGELSSLPRLIAFNGYNQGHISGPIFDDTIRKLGGVPVVRNFGCTDEQAVRQLARHRCNLIIAPSLATHKGGSVQNLLDADVNTGTNYINGRNVDAIFCSSTNLTKELYDELRDLGIRYIYNYYGSTDILPTAISCQASPLDLHVLFGHIALFVVDRNQKHVTSGQRGLVISSRIASYAPDNTAALNEGTQLLNFHVGDEVTFIDEPCKCGRTTPRISAVQRVNFLREKTEGGCEQW